MKHLKSLLEQLKLDNTDLTRVVAAGEELVIGQEALREGMTLIFLYAREVRIFKDYQGKISVIGTSNGKDHQGPISDLKELACWAAGELGLSVGEVVVQ